MKAISEDLISGLLPAFQKRSERAIFRFSGRDAERYLHGRLTQNIKSLKPGEATQSLLLSPQGRIFGLLFLLREDASYLICSDVLSSPEQKAELLHSILQFKVADEVLTEDLSQQLSAAELYEATSNVSRHSPAGVISFTLPYGPIQRTFFIAPLQELETLGATFPQTSAGDLELLRILCKIPRDGVDIHEKVLGPEIEVEPYVSFNKGCYAGQEVVEMATARGRPNRKLCLLSVAGDRSTEGATNEITSASKSTLGQVSSRAYSEKDNTTYLLALLKTAAAEGSEPLFLEETAVRLL